MIKAMLALWAEDGGGAALGRALRERWAPAVLAAPAVRGLALNLPDGGDGARRSPGGAAGPMADAVAAVWLDAAPPAAAAGGAEDGGAVRALGLPEAGGAARAEGWIVAEHRPKRYARDWPDGAPSPGVKLLTLMRPAPGRTPAQCARHWLERHTPLALRVHTGLWNYVQNVVAAPLGDGGGGVFGVVELHFRSRRALREERYGSEAGRRAVHEDIPRFMALDGARGGYFRERILRSPPAPDGAGRAG